jgi:hypothetical protein
MTNVSKFIRANSHFDPETLTVLGDVYDRACDSYCGCKASTTCDAMADRIFTEAMRGERDPEKLWRIATRGLTAPPHCTECKLPMRLTASMSAEKDLPAVEGFKCDKCGEELTREVD